ncbi:ATP-binding protein [Ferruginibacter paludis]|uniref:sensor histidine kinase n=1 Tax=Ferruginibacter paludis TaxID=1310417 RepID=UPI0025B5D4DD|nr:ATP-binding protein [Ferruginibacter paludis]MDN3654079.1 ATP-binding protein [Ferruginibacter paludis]
MKKPAIPENESERLRVLESFDILDTLSEAEFDDITSIASTICNSPISAITLIDKDRQFFKSKIGLEVLQTPRDIAFCAHAINDPSELMIVPDARKDIRFADNPLVTELPHVIFYAGAPLVTTDGYALGTLCVIDHQPKELSVNQKKALHSLANQVMLLFELRTKNKLLRMSEKKVEALAKEMELFVYAASHDLQEPLRMITSFMDLLKKNYGEQLDEKANTYINFATDGGKRMQKLVAGLLDLSRTNTANKEKTLTSLDDTLKEVLQNISTLLKERKAEIIISTPLPVLEVYAEDMGRLFQNLLSNAIKFSNANVPPIVKIAAVEQDKGWLFSIQDNGIGMKAADIEKIFEIFARLHSQSDYQGSGIGLSICKKVVERHGGRIWATSEEGKGSVFYFTIPHLSK